MTAPPGRRWRGLPRRGRSRLRRPRPGPGTARARRQGRWCAPSPARDRQGAPAERGEVRRRRCPGRPWGRAAAARRSSSGEGVSRPRGTTTPLRPWRETSSAWGTPRCSGETASISAHRSSREAAPRLEPRREASSYGDHPVRPGLPRGCHLLPEPGDAALRLVKLPRRSVYMAAGEHDVGPGGARRCGRRRWQRRSRRLPGPGPPAARPGSPTTGLRPAGTGRQAGRRRPGRASPGRQVRGPGAGAYPNGARTTGVPPPGRRARQQARRKPEVDGPVHVGPAQCGQERDARETGQQLRRPGGGAAWSATTPGPPRRRPGVRPAPGHRGHPWRRRRWRRRWRPAASTCGGDAGDVVRRTGPSRTAPPPGRPARPGGSAGFAAARDENPWRPGLSR